MSVTASLQLKQIDMPDELKQHSGSMKENGQAQFELKEKTRKS